MTYYNTVDAALSALNADPQIAWPSTKNRRLWMFNDSYIIGSLNESALPKDGFGWCGLHQVEGSGHVSASGYHRCKKRAFYMKECRPFAVKLLVWDAQKAIVHAKRYWTYFGKEEQAEIEEGIVRALLKSIDHNKIRRESPFAQWSDKANTAVERMKAHDALSAEADKLLAETGCAFVLAA